MTVTLDNAQDVQLRLLAMADYLDAQADEADALGHIPDETARRLTDSGIMRLLQARDSGGYEATPMEWFDALAKVGTHSGGAAWVCGVVGVHPFEIALADRRLQAEIYGPNGETPDVWVASPYAPFGRARKVDGGYLFSGRWPWSTGTYHCEWSVLGGLIVDEDGKPGPNATHTRHFFLPKSDYRTVPEEWDIAGLSGSGSFDVIVEDAFIPDYRVVDPRDLESGEALRKAGREDSALYRMPFNFMFSGTISAAAMAISHGALNAFIDYSRNRSTRMGHNVSMDPHQLAALGAASADLEAGELQFRNDIERVWDLAVANKPIPLDLKLETARNRVRSVQRALSAIDELHRHAGGAVMNKSNPFQRFWRDAHTGGNHGANVAEPKYTAYGLNLFGHPLPEGLKV